MTKIAGSGYGSISQRHGSADPKCHGSATLVYSPIFCRRHIPTKNFSARNWTKCQDFHIFYFVFHIRYLKCALYFSNLQTKKHFANMETQKDFLTWRSGKTLLPSGDQEKLSYLEIKKDSLTWGSRKNLKTNDQKRLSYLEIKKDSLRWRSGKTFLPEEIKKDFPT